MNGRQVSLAGHRFRAVVDPRIRVMDCGDAAASDELRYVRDGEGPQRGGNHADDGQGGQDEPICGPCGVHDADRDLDERFQTRIP